MDQKFLFPFQIQLSLLFFEGLVEIHLFMPQNFEISIYVPGTLLSARDLAVNKMNSHPSLFCFHLISDLAKLNE